MILFGRVNGKSRDKEYPDPGFCRFNF